MSKKTRIDMYAEKYVGLKQKEKLYKSGAEKVGQLLLTEMVVNNVDIVENVGDRRVKKIIRVITKYDPELTEKVKKLKEAAEKQGKVYFETIEYLSIVEVNNGI